MNTFVGRTSARACSTRVGNRRNYTDRERRVATAAFAAGYKKCLSDTMQLENTASLRVTNAFKCACMAAKVLPEDVMRKLDNGQLRRGEASRQRACVWLLMRIHVLDWSPSYPEIAAATGTRSHASVLGAVEKLRQQAREDEQLMKRLADMSAEYIALIRAGAGGG